MKRLVDRLYRHQENKMTESFDTMSAHSRVHLTLGWMFELVAHRFLTKEENLTINWSNGKSEILSHDPLQTYAVLDDLNKL